MVPPDVTGFPVVLVDTYVRQLFIFLGFLSESESVRSLSSLSGFRQPHPRPWLVLFVEPLHGLTFAGMWSAAVEYARRLAPQGAEAKMQALVNGHIFVRRTCAAPGA